MLAKIHSDGTAQLYFNDIGGLGITSVMSATAAGDTIYGFAVATDVINVSARMVLADVYAEIANDATDITTAANILVIGSTSSLAAATAWIAGDADVVA